MNDIFKFLREEIESDVDHFRKTYNLPERYTYKYEDGSGAKGYITTDKPITAGPGKPLNVCIFFDGVRPLKDELQEGK